MMCVFKTCIGVLSSCKNEDPIIYETIVLGTVCTETILCTIEE